MTHDDDSRLAEKALAELEREWWKEATDSELQASSRPHVVSMTVSPHTNTPVLPVPSWISATATA